MHDPTTPLNDAYGTDMFSTSAMSPFLGRFWDCRLRGLQSGQGHGLRWWVGNGRAHLHCHYK